MVYPINVETTNLLQIWSAMASAKYENDFSMGSMWSKLSKPDMENIYERNGLSCVSRLTICSFICDDTNSSTIQSY